MRQEPAWTVCVHPVDASQVAVLHDVLAQVLVAPPTEHCPDAHVFGAVYAWNEHAPG